MSLLYRTLVGALLLTQVQSASGADEQPAPAKDAPMAVELATNPPRPKLAQELQSFLQNWSDSAARIERLEVSFLKFTYDDTFLLEKRATGRFAFEKPGQFCFTQQGSEPGQGVSRKLNARTGKPYTLVKDADQHWVCNGEHLQLINEDEKTYEETAIPPDVRGQDIFVATIPLPFLPLFEPDLKKFEYVLNEKTSATQVWLTVFPRERADLGLWQKADMIIDRQTCFPLAVRFTSPAGTIQSTYSFEAKSLRVNSRGWSGRNDPFHPDLSRHHRLRSPGSSASDDKVKSRGPGDRPAPPALPEQ